MLRKIIFLLALFCASVIFAQEEKKEIEPCATMKIHNEKLEKRAVESSEQFERWLAQKIQVAKANGNGKQRSVITIPYIVHVVHNGEAVGTASNISTAQINDQIAALNRDLRMANADIVNLAGAFQSLAADFEIEFCPAQISPQGYLLIEPGIDRINRNTQGWQAPPYTEAELENGIKSSTIWNPNDYFNIWVAELAQGILGYATFPSSTLLNGLNNPQYTGHVNNDGIVVHYQVFGNGNPGLLPNHTKGRIAVHEVGHWLGLRHIWGDATCGTDYCADTPPQSGPNSFCPTYPSPSCNNNGDLSQNYMDYTFDDCRLMFSNDQKSRAITIMNNSPFRLGLQSSTVCSLPNINVGVSGIVLPCASGISQTVGVKIKNRGITAIAAGDVSVNLSVSGITPATYGTIVNASALSSANDSTIITFTNVNLDTTANLMIVATAALVGDLYIHDNTYTLVTNMGNPLITSTTKTVCRNKPFTIVLSNPRSTATNIQWEISTDNITFNPIANATSNSLTTTQFDSMYYRCGLVCGGIIYTSNSLKMKLKPITDCYCTPVAIGGCASGYYINSVSIGSLYNASGCPTNSQFTFYNNLPPIVIPKNQAINYTLTFGGPIYQQEFAMWIDSNFDGEFDHFEVVAKNTFPIGSYGTYSGTITLPLGTPKGITRLRVLNSFCSLAYGQSCDYGGCGLGETEDYLVYISEPPINVAVMSISQPCIASSNQTIDLRINNLGTFDIPAGNLAIDLNISG
jgi:hypothetical protein